MADNYAPFYNLVKEATDRDSSKVLDGYLYNVSDLDPEEWYYDTHGYTEVNFAASAMLGKTFSSRIKNIKTQWIYKFYQANLQMGRILKTEHILLWMSDPFKHRRTRKGLLKVEEIHQLARDITYGNRGRLKGKRMEDINSSGNCTTLMMAAIIYWQAKEISRIIKEHNPEEAGIDIMLLAHISPIAWSNVILYGEYKLNKDMVK